MIGTSILEFNFGAVPTGGVIKGKAPALALLRKRRGE